MYPTFKLENGDPAITASRDLTRDATPETLVRTDLDEWTNVFVQTDSPYETKTIPQLVRPLGKWERVATTPPIRSRLTAGVDKCGVDIQSLASVIHPSNQPSSQHSSALNCTNKPDFPLLLCDLPEWNGQRLLLGRHWSLWDGKQTGDNETRQFKLYDRHSA